MVICVNMCVGTVYARIGWSRSSHRWQKELNSLNLNSHVVTSFQTRLLGTKLKSGRGTIQANSLWLISLAPNMVTAMFQKFVATLYAICWSFCSPWQLSHAWVIWVSFSGGYHFDNHKVGVSYLKSHMFIHH